ncbi:MAG: hypothetical protein M0Z52_03120 [Actinomycetota bacterium]|nr:hypothetical protein [Actinomycetota bacterium]
MSLLKTGGLIEQRELKYERNNLKTKAKLRNGEDIKKAIKRVTIERL